MRRETFFSTVILAHCWLLVACTSSTDEMSCQSSGGDVSLLLAGDALVTQPWSHIKEPGFLGLMETVTGADAAIVNLETLIHEYRGYAQEESGGTYMASKPEIASELVWAGFDMVAHANNHTFDYGSVGVLESLHNVRSAGLVSAGSGKDLQEARSPAYFESPAGTIGLVSTASTFTRYGRAGRTRPDMRGRPGLNPLAVSWAKNIQVAGLFSLKVPRSEIRDSDLQGNLSAVREAAKNSDIVVFSIHAHKQGEWLERFARQVIDAGAHVFFAHGPHEIRGVEIYKCRPIFYSLGDFVYQYDQVERHPSESYEQYGLGDDATPEDLRAAVLSSGRHPYKLEPQTYQGVVAVIQFRKGLVDRIEFQPVDLGYSREFPDRGRPSVAKPSLARTIIQDLARQSEKYGTEVKYLPLHNTGVVTVGGESR